MNDIKRAFENIKADEKLVSKTKESIYKNYNKKRSFFTPTFAVSGALLMIIICIGGYSINAKTSTISIDINPSVELKLNIYNRVISAVGTNDDGSKVLENLSLKYNTLDEATEKILDSAHTKKMLPENANVNIAVLSNNQKNAEHLTQQCHNSLNKHHSFGNITDMAVDDTTVKEAEKYGISVNKLLIIKQLQQFDPTVTIEEYKNIPTKEIKEEINKYNNNSYPTNGRHHHGSGHHNQ